MEALNAKESKLGAIKIIKHWGSYDGSNPSMIQKATFQLYNKNGSSYTSYGNPIVVTQEAPVATIDKLELDKIYYLKELNTEGQYGYVLSSLSINGNTAEPNGDGYYEIALDGENKGMFKSTQ